jgi:hypothetical protein
MALINEFSNSGFTSAEVEVKYPDYALEKFHYDYSRPYLEISHPLTAVKCMIKIGAFAIESGETTLASKCERAILRTARAFAVKKSGVPGIHGGMLQVACLNRLNKISEGLYIKNDALLTDAKSIEIVRNMLDKRVEYVPLILTMEQMLKGVIPSDNACELIFSKKFPVTWWILNAWYGSPYSDNKNAALNMAGTDLNYEKACSVLSEANFKNSFNARLNFWNNLKIHPLTPQIYPQISFMLKDSAGANAKFRLITLAGLARLFHAENKRWPDMNKDADFIKAAGNTAIDPIDGGKMRLKIDKNGQAIFYSIGFDSSDNNGDSQRDIIVVADIPG